VIKTATEIAFLVLIFSLAFMQPAMESFGPAMTLTEAVFLVTAALFLIALITRQAQLRLERTYVLFGLYAVGLSLSAVFSVDPKFSFFRFLGELYLIALAVLTINIVRTPEMIKNVVLVWLAASGVSAVVGTLAVLSFYLGVTNFLTDFAFHHYGSLPPGNYVRIQGTFLYPSMLCNYLTVSFMLLFASRRMRWIGSSLFIFLLAVFTITAVFTVTPGLGGLILTIGLWLWLVLRERGKEVFGKIALAGGVMAALSFQAVSTFTIIPIETSPYIFEVAGMRIDPTARLLVWTESLQTFLAHPIFGKGVGQNVAEVYFTPPQGKMQIATDAHNTVLSVAAQSGIVGLVPLILICVATFRRALPFDLSTDNTLRTAFGIAFVSAFIVQGMVGSFDDARHLWVLIGLVMAVSTVRSSDRGLSASDLTTASP
jgi:putative inorganic carbon (hco3(-)) transporter